MVKKLAVFCDGTWNQLRTPNLTNVAKLAKCVASSDRAHIQQIVFYDEGVGVDSNIWGPVDRAVSFLGGALGRGLDRKVETAYRFLVLNYDPDDEIFVFGFSRGAYTARSLCGLIRKCGIVRRDSFDKVPEALKLYRQPVHPKDATVVSFRQQYSHPRTTGDEDNWVTAQADANPPQPHSQEHPRAHLFQYRKPLSYRMMYLGLWDTVGSLGVPNTWTRLRFLNKKYRFHDTEASTLLTSLRHAVALEEHRGAFDVTPVGNILELNTKWATATNWNIIDANDPRFVPYNHRPYQQLWFPGHHTNVGGSFEDTGLSNATLYWIAEGAHDAGLAFRQDPLNELWQASQTVNPMEEWHDSKGRPVPRDKARGAIARLTGNIWRSGPQRVDEVGRTSKIRWCCNSAWRPQNLGVMRIADCVSFAPPDPPHGFPPPAPGFPPDWSYAVPSAAAAQSAADQSSDETADDKPSPGTKKEMPVPKGFLTPQQITAQASEAASSGDNHPVAPIGPNELARRARENPPPRLSSGSSAAPKEPTDTSKLDDPSKAN